MAIGGGFKAIRSVVYYSAKIGPWKLWRALRSKNACKACAFGTGGQNGGIHNETAKGIEFCNKNIQAHLSDIRASIPNTVFLQKSIAQLSALRAKQLEDLGRLTTPLYKAPGDQHYSPIRYQDAIELCSARFQASPPEKTFFYASGRSSNEATFLLQLMARLYGTNNINNCSYYCHQASGVALTESIGTGTATVEYNDIDKADLIFVFGANPASNHPRFVKTLLHLRRRGGQVIVINPAKEPGMVRFASPSDWRSMLHGGEDVASLYIQPHLGGDLALIQGIAKSVIALEGHDRSFIHQHTQGFEAFAAHLNSITWQAIETHSGVSRTSIEKIAQLYCRSTRTIFSWSMGLTHHTHGVDTIQTLVALALTRGMLGKTGAGLLPLRGHSNIQGTGSMGFTPQLKRAMEQRLTEQLGQTLPQVTGLDTMACMEAAANRQLNCALMLGGNLLASNPDTQFATEALNQIPFKCYLNSTLNMSHVHGVDQEVLILPVRARDEEKQATTQESMFNYVRLSDGGIERFAQLWSEIEIVVALGARLIQKDRFDFNLFASHERIRQWIGDTVPGFQQLKTIGDSKQEFHIEGRLLHQPQFNTQDGKAQFFCHPLPPRSSAPLLLTSVRSEGQFNSIIYHEFDSYRGQNERWIIMLNPEDMAQQGFTENQKVDIISATGTMTAVKVKPFDIRQGNAMVYYPEANVLVPRAVDKKSRTPGFKSIPIQLQISASPAS